MEVSSRDAESDSGQAAGLPAEALSIISTEHFALQGARAARISESTGRAGMFLSAVSGGLVALGLIATATKVGSAFYAFGLALLPTLSLIGLMTFERVLQSGIEDHGYARRISRLRGLIFRASAAVGELYAPCARAGASLGAWAVARATAGFLTALVAVAWMRPDSAQSLAPNSPG